MQRCFATGCMCYAPHADSTSSVRESAAPSCSMHHLHMPCTRSLLHPALALRFSFASAASWFHCSRWVWVFRHCFVTVWQDVQTLPQCPSSAGGFPRFGRRLSRQAAVLRSTALRAFGPETVGPLGVKLVHGPPFVMTGFVKDVSRLFVSLCMGKSEYI